MTKSLEIETWNLLKDTYPDPTYMIVWNKRSEDWLPDFIVKRAERVLFVMEVKDTHATDETTDSQMKRAFASMALYYLRNREESFLVIPSPTKQSLKEKYYRFFQEISCPIITKDVIPQLKNHWH